MENRSAATPEALALVSTVIRDVARGHRLSAADRQDFAQTVHLKFVERNYDVLTRFRGESSLRTYLTVVISRALLDWRNARYGKWRPSAAATRLGAEAIRLETLMGRDGYDRDAAIEIVSAQTGTAPDRLRRLAVELPRRWRPRVVQDDYLQALAERTAPDPIEAEERRQRGLRVRRALARAYRELPADERRLLSLRYRSDLSVRQISEALQTDQKALYRQFDRVVAKLRTAVVGQVPADLSAPF